MKNETYIFYESKLRIFCLLFWSVLFVFGCYFMTNSTVLYERCVGYFGMIFFGLGFVKAISKIFSSREYVEITPTYIRIEKFEKLLWTDIISTHIIQIRGTKLFCLNVKDISKYNLTFMQKINQMLGYAPFCISLVTLSKKDSKKMQQMIKKYVHDK